MEQRRSLLRCGFGHTSYRLGHGAEGDHDHDNKNDTMTRLGVEFYLPDWTLLDVHRNRPAMRRLILDALRKEGFLK